MIFAAAATLGAGAADAQDWQALGPSPVSGGEFAGTTGRVAAIAPSRHQADVYFAATASGGVWRSTDGGQSWAALTDHLPTTALGAIALDPRDENIVYAGSGEANYAYHSLYGAGVYVDRRRRVVRVLAASRFTGLAFSRLAVAPNGTAWAASLACRRHRLRLRGRPPASAPERADGTLSLHQRRQDWTLVRNGLPDLPAADVDIDPRDPRASSSPPATCSATSATASTCRPTAAPPSAKCSASAATPSAGIALAIAPSTPTSSTRSPRAPPDARRPAASRRSATRRSPSSSPMTAARAGGRPSPATSSATRASTTSPSRWRRDDPRIVIVGGVQMVRSTDGGDHVRQRHTAARRHPRRGVRCRRSLARRRRRRHPPLEQPRQHVGDVERRPRLGAVLRRDGSLSPRPRPRVVGSQDNGTHVRRPDGSWERGVRRRRRLGDGAPRRPRQLRRAVPGRRQRLLHPERRSDLRRHRRGGRARRAHRLPGAARLRARRDGVSAGRSCSTPPPACTRACQRRLRADLRRRDDGSPWAIRALATDTGGLAGSGPPAATATCW